MKRLSIKSTLPQLTIKNKRICLRVDFNVPCTETSFDSYKLEAVLPTINYLLQHEAKSIILFTHWGRPTAPTPLYSTERFIPWFQSKGYTIEYVPDTSRALHSQASIILMENLRFFPAEYNHDVAFLEQLAPLGSLYINDSFGTLHRDDSSLRLTALRFDKHHRAIGFLIEKEITELNNIFSSPSRFFIMGGNKLKDKIKYIQSLLSSTTTIGLCPGIATPFLYAQGFSVGVHQKEIEPEMVQECKKIIEYAQENSYQLIMPQDLLVQSIKTHLYRITVPACIKEDEIIIAIGPATTQQYITLIFHTPAVLYNGLMGFINRPETTVYTKTLFEACTKASGFTIIAGGDSVAAARLFNCANKVSYCSTGGGATLAYMSHSPLPGLEPFKTLGKN